MENAIETLKAKFGQSKDSESLLQLLKELEKLEESVRLPYINADVVWKIGSLAYERAKELGLAIVIDITSSSGQVYFHSASRNGTSLDNENWVNRKKRTVLHFGKSSLYMGWKLHMKNIGRSSPLSMEEVLFIDSKDHAVHGGSVPIRLSNVDGLWGTLTVSGLAQVDDHKFAMTLLADIKKDLEN